MGGVCELCMVTGECRGAHPAVHAGAIAWMYVVMDVSKIVHTDTLILATTWTYGRRACGVRH